MAIASWSLVRVYGTWTDAKGNMLSGTYKISVPARLTNSTDDLIIPAGTYDSGALNTTPGATLSQTFRYTVGTATSDVTVITQSSTLFYLYTGGPKAARLTM